MSKSESQEEDAGKGNGKLRSSPFGEDTPITISPSIAHGLEIPVRAADTSLTDRDD